MVDGWVTASGPYSLTMAGGAAGSGAVFQSSTANQDGSHCASEGDVCNCNGMVRQGAGSMWTATRSAGAIGCNNLVFDDPIYDTGKSCLCYPDAARTGDTSGDEKVMGQNAPDNAYLIQVPAGGARHVVDACASSTNFDTFLRIMGTNGRQLEEHDDGGCSLGGCSGSDRGLQFKLFTPLLAAGDQLVVVDGWSTSSGRYSLSTNFAPTRVDTHIGICGYDLSPSCPTGYTRVSIMPVVTRCNGFMDWLMADDNSRCLQESRKAVCTRIVAA